MSTETHILLIIPLVIIEFILLFFGLREWMRCATFKIFSKWVWLPVILFVGIFGPIGFLMLGRENGGN